MYKKDAKYIEILTPYHKFWNPFWNRLNDKLKQTEGCNSSLEDTIKIIKTLPNIDLKKTLKFFREAGGFCDCEVLMNVPFAEWKDVKKFLENNLKKTA